MTTYICAYAFTCFIYELYVDETEINYETTICTKLETKSQSQKSYAKTQIKEDCEQ